MTSDEEFSCIKEAGTFLKERVPSEPDVGFILGSGLGGFGALLQNPVDIPYSDIPHCPVSSVVGHSGRLLFGAMHGLQVAVLSGRVHYYEGYPLDRVVFPTRVLGELGIRRIVITNAAGGINRDFRPGNLMLISDHINLLGTNPLRGPNLKDLGERFPDMSEAYNGELRLLAMEAAESLGLELCTGVYAAVPGPSYETPAEIEMLRRMGADAVGMSTVPEVIAANHMGLQVLGISCITNMAAGVLPQKIKHAEVLETTARVREAFTGLLDEFVRRLHRPEVA